jgi:hypothetical protein
MQFNFLGGNTQRDTLQNALGQRNQVLESQLDFSKSAFTTGVQGVGNTMREAMRLGQAETESVRRDKTTIRESMLSRQKDQDLLTQRLEADKTAYERSLADQDTRTKDARQRRLDDEAAARENANLDQAARERRDRDEFNRRLGLTTTDKIVAENKEIDRVNKTVTGELEGFKSRFEGELDLIDLEGDSEEVEYNDDGTAKLDDEGNPILAKRGKMRDKIKSHFKGIYEQANAMSDPYQRQAFLKQMSGQMNLVNIRGMYDPKFKAEEEKRKADERARGVTSRETGPRGA